MFKQVLSSRNSSLYFDLQKEAKIFDTVQQQRSLQTSIPIRVGVVYNSVFIESSTRIWILLQILCIHHSISVIANCCNYPSFHFTCLFPDKFVSWHIATSQLLLQIKHYLNTGVCNRKHGHFLAYFGFSIT